MVSSVTGGIASNFAIKGVARHKVAWVASLVGGLPVGCVEREQDVGVHFMHTFVAWPVAESLRY